MQLVFTVFFSVVLLESCCNIKRSTKGIFIAYVPLMARVRRDILVQLTANLFIRLDFMVPLPIWLYSLMYLLMHHYNRDFPLFV